MSGPRGAVLLVDDEAKILKRLGRALREQGHDVVEAGSARDAQRQLAQRPFDLFVIDNVMPGTTGLELLRDEGHDVVEAGSAREAQRQLTQRAFDLFVVDNVMPGMTGLELLRDVFSSLPESDRPQVVMMTAHGSTQIVREAFKLGVEDFLEKPF